MSGTSDALKDALAELAREASFDAFGVTAPDALGEVARDRLTAFLADGRHGDMAWMADTAD
ncbi:MAG: tRNA epoxyqueuosine(34) reductase QueG, partial [Hyphomicrobiaceae bacterium]|nr:tRNA epoxyqueuosine(34) reductase QueG [Hyphomicrobiaceae bacterium]